MSKRVALLRDPCHATPGLCWRAVFPLRSRGPALALAALVAGCATAGGDWGGGEGDARPAVGPDAAMPPARFDAAPRPDARITPPSADAGGCTPTWTDLLRNGNFDLGPSVWEQISGAGLNLIVPAAMMPIAPHSPSYATWFGGYLSSVDELGQPFAVPADALALRLRGYACVATEELPGSGVWDILTITLADAGRSALETFGSLTNEDSASSCWTMFERNAALSHAGQPRYLHVAAITDAGANTNFFLDSLAVEALVCR